MNQKLKKLIEEKILNEGMNLEDAIEFIWNIKDNGDQTKL